MVSTQMVQATTFVLLAETHIRGVSVSPEPPDPLPDPRAFVDDERTEAGSEEVATAMSQTEAEVDELPVDVDMVRRVSMGGVGRGAYFRGGEAGNGGTRSGGGGGKQISKKSRSRIIQHRISNFQHFHLNLRTAIGIPNCVAIHTRHYTSAGTGGADTGTIPTQLRRLGFWVCGR